MDQSPALPKSVVGALTTSAAGSPIDAAVRQRVEPQLGVDLGHVRVRRDAVAASAAAELHARAFTTGSTIFLASDSSPSDVALIAHEATHVAQQAEGTGAAATLLRAVTDYLPDVSVDDLIPDWVLDGVRDTVRSIPGYTLLTYVVGSDPLTDRPVEASRETLVETLLSYGPFADAVGPVLQGVGVLGEIFTFVSEGLHANGLTLSRISRDIDAAWDELSVSNGIEGNAAIVRRYVNAFLTDVRNFVTGIVDRVLAIVRAVVVDFAEPLLQTPEIAPIWNLTKKVLRYDPLRGQEVRAPTAEIIADFLRLIGQEQRLAQMEERGTLQETADWLDTQLATFSGLIGELGTLFSEAWAAIQPANLPDLFANLTSLAQRAFGFVQRVGAFAATLIGKVLELVKKALLGWLSEHAHSVPGFRLLTVILERNPFTDEAVPRTAENLIRGFITLMPGGEETYDQLAEAGVISDAADRITSAMTTLGISWELVTGTFLGIWNSFSLDDLLAPIAAFQRVLAQFGEPLARIIVFVRVVIEVVITLILRLLNFPSDLLGSIISNTLQAIEDIKRDPVGFLLNMLDAVKRGFLGFFDNIVGYLAQGLQAWLFRGLGKLGITIPTDFTLQSVLGLVVQVLGLSIDMLWEKLGQHIGPERVEMIRGAIDRLSGAWQFIKDVQEGGVAAVWRYVTDQLSGLWDTLLDMAKEWIMTTIIQRVTAKLLSMLDPTGVMAVVNSFIAFFNAIQSAIEYLRDILEIINRYVTTFAQIAAGNVVQGAQMLEQGLAAAIPIAIGFLANQVGLGNVPEKIVELIGRLRALVDRALDWLIGQAVRLGQAALRALGVGPQQPTDTAERLVETFELSGQQHKVYTDVSSGELLVASDGEHRVSDIDKLRVLYREYQQLPRGATQRQRMDVLDRIAAMIKADPSLVALITGSPASALGLDTAVGDSVLIRRNGRSGDILGVHVVAVQQVLGVGDSNGVAVVGIRVQHPERGRVFMPYTTCGDLTDPSKNWQKEPGGKPALVGFTPVGGPGRGGHARIGTPLPSGTGASIPRSLHPTIGYGPPGLWIRAGHLVAREFGGPGSYSSGNIVPMTEKANQTKAGMRRIEIATSRAVAADPGGVFDYSVTVTHAPTQIPPTAIFVTVAKIWPPGSALPSAFPSVPYEVDNTM